MCSVIHTHCVCVVHFNIRVQTEYLTITKHHCNCRFSWFFYQLANLQHILCILFLCILFFWLEIYFSWTLYLFLEIYIFWQIFFNLAKIVPRFLEKIRRKWGRLDGKFEANLQNLSDFVYLIKFYILRNFEFCLLFSSDGCFGEKNSGKFNSVRRRGFMITKRFLKGWKLFNVRTLLSQHSSPAAKSNSEDTDYRCFYLVLLQS